jgi:2-isopropylmalate synthase
LALRYEDLGYAIPHDELDVVYQRFTTLADRKKRIYDQDLIGLLQAPTVTTERLTGTNWSRASSAA